MISINQTPLWYWEISTQYSGKKTQNTQKVVGGYELGSRNLRVAQTTKP